MQQMRKPGSGWRSVLPRLWKCGTESAIRAQRAAADSAEIADRVCHSGIFFGIFGFHNFYAGRTACGVIQLLITILSCGSLTGISGLWAVVEMFAVSRDSRKVPMQGGSVSLSVVLAVIWLALASLVVWMFLAIHEAQETTRTISCASNLKDIGQSLMQYAADFDNRFPPQGNADGLELLRSTGILPWHECYVCPSSTTEIKSSDEPLTDANCDYIYLGGLTTCHDWARECPVIFERPGSHSKARINILYGNGKVSIVRLPDSVLTVTDLLEYLADQADNPKVKEFLRRKQRNF